MHQEVYSAGDETQVTHIQIMQTSPMNHLPSTENRDSSVLFHYSSMRDGCEKQSLAAYGPYFKNRASLLYFQIFSCFLLYFSVLYIGYTIINLSYAE